MLKTLIMACLLFTLSVYSAGSDYWFYSVDPTIHVDGPISDTQWIYFIDTIHSDNNVLYRSDTVAWTNKNSQLKCWATCDNNYIYFAVRILRDDCWIPGHDENSDRFMINPGGRNTAIYINTDSSPVVSDSGCPFQQCKGIWAAANPSSVPPYSEFEVAMDKTIVDPFGFEAFQMAIGFLDADSAGKKTYVFFGVDNSGSNIFDKNNLENPMYYPTFTFNTPIGRGKRQKRQTISTINVSCPPSSQEYSRPSSAGLVSYPNPFTPSTTLHYNVKSSGSLKIYDMSGKEVKRFDISGAGRAVWDASGLASGVYLARLISGKDVLNTRLFLIR